MILAGNNPAKICLFKVNNKITRKRCKICSKIISKTPERVSLLMTLNKFYDVFSNTFLLRRLSEHPWMSAIFSTKSSTHPWVFFTLFKLYKWYQIAQHITYCRSNTLQKQSIIIRRLVTKKKVFLKKQTSKTLLKIVFTI